MRRICWTVLASALFWSGCATTPVDWDARVGQYTYDDAVMEMGVPDRQTTLSDGSIVAEWLTRRGNYYNTYPMQPRFSRMHVIDLQKMPDWYLRLVFGPDRRLVRVEKAARD